MFAYLLIAKHKLQDQQILTISLSSSDLDINHHATDKAKIEFKSKRKEIIAENYPNKLFCVFFLNVSFLLHGHV